MRYLRIVVVLLLSVTGSTASADALLDRARALHDSGNAQQAWELLAPLNAERAGIVEYDYLLGVVALDTGRRTEAIFAFERVLAVEPGHAEARAEIGRTYFELNELQRAKIQFDQVLQEDSVPDAARRQIGKFLSAIEAIETDVKTDWKAYVSFALGSDDNVNSGPSSSQIAVPLFGGAIVALDDSALPEESSFTQTRARFDLLHKFNAKAQLLAGAAIAQRSNYDSDAEAFDTSSIDFNFGFRYLRSESNHLLVSLQGQDFKLDGDAYRAMCLACSRNGAIGSAATVKSVCIASCPSSNSMISRPATPIAVCSGAVCRNSFPENATPYCILACIAAPKKPRKAPRHIWDTILSV